MTKTYFDEIRAFALRQGFDRVYALPPKRFDGWLSAMGAVGEDHRARRLLADPFALLPSVTAVIVLIAKYRPFSAFPRGFGRIPAYYLLSQQTREWAKAVAAFIEETAGKQALASPRLPHRAAAILAGAGQRGLHQLLLTPGLGSFINISLVLTDAFDAPEPDPAPSLCTGCGACAAACPTQALAGDGTWDYRRCLRHQMSVNAFGPEARESLGTLLGCEICQTACPVNRAFVSPVPAPADIVSAFELGPILNLRHDPALKKRLGGLIGSNLLRGNRLTNQALVLTARQGLTEHRRAVEVLLNDPNPVTAELAAWALTRLG